AWGNPTKTEASDEVKDNRYRYAGYQYDEETGLYYLMARYYEPRNGVFLSLDPDPGSDGDSLDQNGYTYGNNNPVMNVDPDGHWVWFVVNAGFAVYDGYKAYKSGKGWKGVAVAAASGFVGGGKLKLTKKIGKWATSRHWYKGTFKTKRKSLDYHHNKHIVRNGKSYSKKRYTKVARAFYRSNKHLREKVILATGKKGYRIKNGKRTGYYTRSGKVVTFVNNKWKKKKKR
ncbi:RHS repeat-associated core domain-containing protein, partial [Bacillus sp. Rc4]